MFIISVSHSKESLEWYLLIAASWPVFRSLPQITEWHTAEQIKKEPTSQVVRSNGLVASNEAPFVVDRSIELDYDVYEEDHIHDQVVIDVAPIFTKLHKGQLERDQEGDDDLIDQDDRSVDKVYPAEGRKEAFRGDLRLDVALDVRLLVFQDRFEFSSIYRNRMRKGKVKLKSLLSISHLPLSLKPEDCSLMIYGFVLLVIFRSLFMLIVGFCCRIDPSPLDW